MRRRPHQRAPRRWRAGALIAVCTAAAYVSSLNNPLLQDDNFAVAHNPHLKSLANIPRYFADPSLFTVRGHGKMYRPVLLTFLAFEYAIGDAIAGDAGAHVAWHVGNIVTHTAAACAAAVLLAHLCPPRLSTRWPLVGGLLFALHPFNSFAVNLVNTRSSTLSTALMCAAMACYIAASRRTSNAARLGIASLVLGIAAILSKSSGIVLVGWVAAYEVVLGPTGVQWSVRRAGLRLLPFALMAVAYIALRQHLFDVIVAKAYVRPVSENILLAVSTVPLTLRLLLWPTGLTLYHHAEALLAAPGWLYGGAACIAFLLGMGVVAGRTVLMILLWAACAWAPYVLIPLNIPYAEHRMYTVAAMLVVAICTACARSLWMASTRRAAVVVILVSFAALTVTRMNVWGTPVTVFRDAVSVRPESGRARMDLGGAYLNANKPEQALREYTRAARDPAVPMAQWNRGLALLRLGRAEEAEQVARDFIARYGPYDVAGDGYFVLGRALMAQGRYGEAVAAFETTLSRSPRSLNARYALGRAHISAGEPAAAAETLRPLIEQDPHRPEVQYSLAQAYLESGRPRLAAHHFHMVTQMLPERIEAHWAEGMARQQMGDISGAAHKFHDALRLNPHFAPAREALDHLRRSRTDSP